MMKKDLVQVMDQKTGKYVKINRATGEIISHKATSGPYKGGIPIEKRKPSAIYRGGIPNKRRKPSDMASKEKIRTVKEPAVKPDSFTRAQAEEAVRKVSAKRSKGKVFVVLKDIIIPRGTALRLAASEVTRPEPHYEHFVGFVDASDACGEFVISECDLEAAPEYFVELKD